MLKHNKDNKKEKKTGAGKQKKRIEAKEQKIEKVVEIEEKKEKKAGNISNIIEQTDFDNFVNFFTGNVRARPIIREVERPAEDIETGIREINAEEKNVKYFSASQPYNISSGADNSSAGGSGNYSINERSEGVIPVISNNVMEKRVGEFEILGVSRNVSFTEPNLNKLADDYFNKENAQYKSTANIEEIQNERTSPGERRKSKF